MNKKFNVRFFFFLILIVSLLGSFILGGISIMIFDDGIYSFHKIKSAFQIGVFFPCLFISDLLFYFLIKQKCNLFIALCPFLIPIIAEFSVCFYFEKGYIPPKYLCQSDYRIFSGTSVYPLVVSIVRGNELPDVDAAGLNYQDSASGMTPLLFCIRNQYYEEAIHLLKLGASPNIVDNKTGVSPLMELCSSCLSDTVISQRKMNLLNALIEKNADVNYVVEGKWPLMILSSCRNSNIEWCNLLIENGANLNLKYIQEEEYLHECYKENESALNMAVYQGNFQLALSMIKQGADTIGYGNWMVDILNSNFAETIRKDKYALSLLNYQNSK